MTNNRQEDKFLYHYCSNEVMISILKNKQLWMSDISRSNDYSELGIFLPNIFYEIEDLYNTNPFELKYNDENNIYALVDLLRDVDKYIGGARINGFLTSFVVCFSEDGDSLSQWRGYANNGKGCSLGFSQTELEHYCKKHQDRINFKKVQYIDHDEAKRILRVQAEELLEFIRKLRDESKDLFHGKAMTEKIINQNMMLLLIGKIEDFVLNSLQYKWNSFKEENEWRMFFTGITKDDKTLFGEQSELSVFKQKYDKDMILHGKLCFYAKEDCIIPYYPIYLFELSNIPIKQFILGPKNRSYEQDIKLLFAKEKMGDADISRSSISYR